MKNNLDRIVFTEAVRRVDDAYGVYSQLIVFGDTLDNFMLAPKENSLYGTTDMEFIAEQIKAECEVTA